MGGVYIGYGGRGEAYTGFWWGNLKEREHLREPDVDQRIILRWILGSGMWDMDRIELAQDRKT